MTTRSPIAVFFLTIFTLGIYAIVWRVTTKGEMNRLGANIPTAWLMIVPFANIYWLWKYAEGVEQVTDKALTQVVTFILLFVIPIIGDSIIQDAFNKVTLRTVVING